jgi:hypothetical protein
MSKENIDLALAIVHICNTCSVLHTALGKYPSYKPSKYCLHSVAESRGTKRESQ